MTILAVAAGFAADLCLRRPALASHPSSPWGTRSHGPKAACGAHSPQTSAGTRAAGACARRGASACVWALTWGILYLCGMVHPRLALRGRGMGELSDSRGMRAAPPEPGRGPRVLEGRPCRGARSRRAHRGTRRVCSRRAGRRTRRRGNGGGERERRRHRAAFLPYDRGAPLGMAYKAVNTLDSMVGYKNERYIDFGCASARLDDAVNWIPSRLSALFMIAVCPIVGLDARGRRASGAATGVAMRARTRRRPSQRARARLAAPGRTRGVFRQAR